MKYFQQPAHPLWEPSPENTLLGAMLLLTLLTVSVQAVRAALENPVKSLMME